MLPLPPRAFASIDAHQRRVNISRRSVARCAGASACRQARNQVQPGIVVRWRKSRATLEDRMGWFSKDIQTMDDLFLHGLKDIYYAEKQIVAALPKMIEKATNR